MTFLGTQDERADVGPVMIDEPLPLVADDGRASLLLVAQGARSDRLKVWAERSGLRCVGQIGLDEAAGRLERMVSLDLLLIDLRGMDVAARLGRRDALALALRCGLAGTRLLVLVDLAGLDCAVAMLDAPATDFLCEPGDGEIVTWLVLAGLGEGAPGRMMLHDPAREEDAGRLDQLSEEVRRLAATIERLSFVGGAAPCPANGAADRRDGFRVARGEAPDPARLFQPRDRHRGAAPAEAVLPTHAEVRAVIRARRLRDQFLPADLFADPAWDMMLDLMAARLAGQRVSVSSLCIAAAVPPTTALRWIRQLTDRAVFARIDDPVDGRRVFIELTDAAAQAMVGWVQAVRRNGGLFAGSG
jgi:hypothetical protein